MLVEAKKDIFSQLIKEATHDELVWMNGFLAGLLDQRSLAAGKAGAMAGGSSSAEVAGSAQIDKLTLLYASETGNAKSVATKFAAATKKRGIKTKLVSVEQYKLTDLAKEKYLLLVISTQGDGEPPITAVKFYNAVHDANLKLDKLQFGVMALGDSSYPLFCQAGEDVDKQLELRGGTRKVPLQKCDTDYASYADSWLDAALGLLAGSDGGAAAPSAKALAKAPAAGSHKKIYEGTVITNFNLNDRDSAKRTHHIEIEAEDLLYAPGDALGLVPPNPKAVVEEILSLTEVDAQSTIAWRDQTHSIEELLSLKAQLLYLPERVVRKYADIAGQEIPDTRMSLVDLLKIYPLKNNQEDFQQVLQILEPIAPRLYSISSSPEAHGDEIHITVARDQFYVGDKKETGLCSGYLIDVPVETKVQFYIHPNKGFKLPPEDKDVIMIGPGTGVAPFRSFLFERDAAGAEGRNWLFFGDQHIASDFLYQTEIQAFLETGVLTEFNGAFSRDQQNKVYVQDKMRERGAELFEWLENGAYIYICGAKEPMSFDVEKALTEIIATQKELSFVEATKYLDALKEEGRFLKDVY
ncbi:sulfite reductase (NADPH) alpha subunit [Arachidicoccus rhizosphaerae]|jgi:sulfite reductase (NADPH) flavoprotein alpha-component|uniref:assimilatory sulfite reductase (NADPH) n=1 Tax=Arachidicoccus rhizosphaerae TaxID=551991 RepID=A0A1H4A7B7_9BACT|nr:flavodoxin domain-containing protein [Arachidicoccus rhizosphaerae]SEA31334.1 sulfite reductase (NADPH) alpha subunit [Arachidicoccus rhizosphaerae]